MLQINMPTNYLLYERICSFLEIYNSFYNPKLWSGSFTHRTWVYFLAEYFHGIISCFGNLPHSITRVWTWKMINIKLLNKEKLIIKTFPQWEGFVLWVSLQLQIISVTLSVLLIALLDWVYYCWIFILDR